MNSPDTLIRAVSLYDTEVWFMDECFTVYKAVQRSVLSGRILDKFPLAVRFTFEKVHNEFCKCVLGVRRTASNIASKSELGRLPLESFIKTQVKDYCTRINSHGIDPHLLLTKNSMGRVYIRGIALPPLL